MYIFKHMFENRPSLILKLEAKPKAYEERSRDDYSKYNRASFKAKNNIQAEAGRDLDNSESLCYNL